MKRERGGRNGEGNGEGNAGRRAFLREALGGGALAALSAWGVSVLSACKQKVTGSAPAPQASPNAGACAPGSLPYRVVQPAASSQAPGGGEPPSTGAVYGLAGDGAPARYERAFLFDRASATFHLALALDPSLADDALRAVRISWRVDDGAPAEVPVRDPASEADGNTFDGGRFTALLLSPRAGRRVTLVVEGVAPGRVLRAEVEGEFDEPPPLGLLDAGAGAGYLPPGFTQPPRGIHIVPRAQWSAQSPRAPAEKARWTKIVVHHSAQYFAPGTDPGSVVRSYQRDHIHGKGWDDIGYNFLVAPDGRVFEGRNGGKDAQGAHTQNANGETVGINFMGQFHDPEPGAKNEPTQAQLDSGARLMAWLAHECGIALDGTSSLSGGSRASLPNVTMHRDVGATFPGGGTACPGSRMYGKVSTMREAAIRYKQEYSAPAPVPSQGPVASAPC